MKEFFITLQGKIITGLTILALLLGIVTEGITIYRQSIGALIDRENLIKVTGEAAMTKQKADYRTAPLGNMTEAEQAKRACQEGLDIPGLHCK